MFHQPLAILVTLLVLALSAFAQTPGAVTCGHNVYSLTDVHNAIHDGRLHFNNPISEFGQVQSLLPIAAY